MPARKNMYLLPSGGIDPPRVPDFNISQIQVEELMSDIKNKLSLSPRKARTFDLKTARASPYKIPAREKKACWHCARGRRCRKGCKEKQTEKDPYEVLQQLLHEGNLIQEAVRRVNLSFGTTPKRRLFYSSDSEQDEAEPEVDIEGDYDGCSVLEAQEQEQNDVCSPMKRFEEGSVKDNNRL